MMFEIVQDADGWYSIILFNDYGQPDGPTIGPFETEAEAEREAQELAAPGERE